MREDQRIESELEVRAYIQNMRHAMENGARLTFQKERRVDAARDFHHTNQYTVADLFPDEAPAQALRRELSTLTVKDYLRTVKDTRFPKRSEMREFGKVYPGHGDVYIKIRVELLDPAGFGNHTVFVMSFHYAETPLSEETFPYRKNTAAGGETL